MAGLRPLKPGLDCRPLQRQRSARRGIGRVTRELVTALLERPELASPVLFFDHGPIPEEWRGYRWARLPALIPWRREVSRLAATCRPWNLRRSGIDAFLASDVLQGIPRGVPVVSIAYDLIPLRYPEIYLHTGGPRPLKGLVSRFGYRRLTSVGYGRAAAVAAISEPTRQELIGWLGIAPRRVTVASPGISPGYRPLQLPREPLLLYVGGTDRRKRVEELIEGFAALIGQPGLTDFRLMLVGGEFLERTPLTGRLARPDLRGRVLRPGHVPEAELVQLYNRATALVLPSRAEGFGLTPVEALACGTPVIVARDGEYPLELGDLKRELDPAHPATLAAAVRSIVESPDYRRQVAEQGPVFASQFRWERMAGMVIGLLERVASGRR